MGKSLEQVKESLSKERQKKINARTAELISEEMTMRELRKAMDMTQKELAKKMMKNQDEISRIEARSDILLSTLQKFVIAMGGQLALIAEFPNRAPISLSGFTTLDNPNSKNREYNAAKGTSKKRAVKRRAVAR